MVQKQFSFFFSLVFTIRKVLLLLLPLPLPLLLFAQCPTASFIIPDTVCPGEILTIINTSDSSAASFEWDFCGGELKDTTPAVDYLKTLTPPSSLPLAMTLINEDSNWFGFVSNYGGGNLFRLDFGNSLNNIPSDTNLGNLGAFSQPEDIRFIRQDSTWYALLVSRQNNLLLRLNFGNSLFNTPTVDTVDALTGVLNEPRGIDIAVDNDSIIAVISNYTNETITIVNFGSSITNDTPAIFDTIISDASELLDIALVNDCGNWYGILLSYTTPGKIFKLNFGNSLLNTPSINEIPSASSLITKPAGISIQRDLGEIFAFIQSSDGNLFRLDFGTDMITNNPDVVDLGKSTTTSSNKVGIISMAKQGSEWHAFTIDWTTSELFKLTFDDSCSATTVASTDPTPVNISYDQSGLYYISLLAYNDSGDVSSYIDSVFLPKLNPDFISNYQCKGEAAFFYDSSNPTGSNINSWYWDFGDTLSDTIQNPTHQYVDTGLYNVKLIIQDMHGCVDSIIKPVRIYNKPTPGFSYPDSICSNDSIQFVDTSSWYLDSIISWRWDFGTGDTSILKDPLYLFDSGGTHFVTLTVGGISGCDTSISDSIDVLEGPAVNFFYNTTCIGDSAYFSDSTTGSNLNSWYWDFGDSFTSDSIDPVHYYNSTGEYFVTLAVGNDNGCINSLTKQVNVVALPVANFTLNFSCSNILISFFDLSDTVEGTIVGWAWDFGNNDTSNLQNPFHTYTSGGDYLVTLIVTTNYGCKDTLSDSLSVLQSPVPDFTFISNCEGDPVQFFDQSADTFSASINGWEWNFGGGNVSYDTNAIYSFDTTGIYTVSLMVTDTLGCNPSISKQVLVYDKPKVDFGYPDILCINFPVKFFDSSFVTYDSIVNWNWEFGIGNTDTLQNPFYTFPNSGFFPVTLIATSNRGCVDTTSKTLIIYEIPDANFEFEPQYGTPPLDVNFTNQSSSDTVCYLWDFGDNSDPDTSFSPSHQYTDTNTYNITLIVCNIYGCSDTIIKEIKVMPPVLDAQVIWVCYTEEGDYLSIETRILNSGTRVINSLDLILEIGGSLVVKEKWTGTLKAGEVLYYNFAAQVLKSLTSELPYFCVIVDNPNNEADEIPGNNRQCELCTLLVDDFTVLPLRPNPANDEVKISFILPYKEEITISLFDILGKKITNFIPQNINKGYNELIIDVTYLVKGVYILRYDFDNKIFNQKLIRN